MDRFKAAHASAEDWAHAAQGCVDVLGKMPEGANLGFLYVTDVLADDVANIVAYLRQHTGVEHWVGSVGIGVCGGDKEYFDLPALAVMVGAFPENKFRVFPTIAESVDQLSAADTEWIARQGPTSALVHASPENAKSARLLFELAETTNAFLLGGMTSSRGSACQIAGRLTGGGVSGVLFAPEVPLATCLSQGCRVLGESHLISDCLDNVIIGLDGRRAMEVFVETLGSRYRDDPLSAARHVLAAIPVEGSDIGDYLVRDIVAIDPQRGWLAVGSHVHPGDRLMFVERDAVTATTELIRSLERLKSRLDTEPKGAIYISCIARGPGMFGKSGTEIGIIRQAFGELPLVGFFANGEISNARVYGYTGVLILFT